MKKSKMGRWLGTVCALGTVVALLMSFLLAAPAMTLENVEEPPEKSLPAAEESASPTEAPSKTEEVEEFPPEAPAEETALPLVPPTELPPEEIDAVPSVPPASDPTEPIPSTVPTEAPSDLPSPAPSSPAEGDPTPPLPTPSPLQTPPVDGDEPAAEPPAAGAFSEGDEPILPPAPNAAEEEEPPIEEEEPQILGEPMDAEALQELLDSGFFSRWEDSSLSVQSGRILADEVPARRASTLPTVQIVSAGGEAKAEADGVTVCKTIKPTELENVFDITLAVQTTLDMSAVLDDPDMAVVVVMDISNTMTYKIGKTEQTRLEAATLAAEAFIDLFAEKSGPRSTIGYVAFNTNVMEFFPMSQCNSTAQAIQLKNTLSGKAEAVLKTMNNGTENRFTNMEGGLKMAQDMLATQSNPNQFIVFLSDGFPTTYTLTKAEGVYDGYYPASSEGQIGTDGVFADAKTGKYCLHGSSYSDKAAARAESIAETVKDSGIKIFSVGVDIGGQKIQTYLDQTANQPADMEAPFSVVDRGDTDDFVIGDASDTAAYANWLEKKIGSGTGYYYSAEDTSRLSEAFQAIFRCIQAEASAASQAEQVIDPIPDSIEFIGLWDRTGSALKPQTLSGSGENAAEYTASTATLCWDLKNSYRTTASADGQTICSYSLVYRIRLKNEAKGFEENKSYLTNGTTTLSYQVVTDNNGQTSTESKTLDFPIPSVQGYLADLAFQKKDQHGGSVEGAQFTLTHDTALCNACRGDGTAVAVGPYTAVSDKNGAVNFVNIPSGHQYRLEETYVPPLYQKDDSLRYLVSVSYDELFVTELCEDDELATWAGDETIVIYNTLRPAMPNTGGVGVIPFLSGGGCLTAAGWLLCRRGRKKRA